MKRSGKGGEKKKAGRERRNKGRPNQVGAPYEAKKEKTELFEFFGEDGELELGFG